MSAEDILAQLGLELAPTEHELALSQGIRVRYRTPTAIDCSMARHRVAECLESARGVAAAMGRYGIAKYEWGVLLDPDHWEGMGSYLFAIELGCIVVQVVERRGDQPDQVWSVAPDPRVMAFVLGQKGHLDAFLKATDEAAGSLIRPKKGPAPSPTGSSAAAAHTAKAAS